MGLFILGNNTVRHLLLHFCSADEPVRHKSRPHGGTCADCGDAAHLHLWLFVDELCEALSQVAQVADFHIKDVDDASDLDL